MFTGIITDIGTVRSITRVGDVRLEIETAYDLRHTSLGASIACDGVCLTVVEKQDNLFVVDVSEESVSCTTIGRWEEGYKVNLEQALKVGDELGGHFVSGHVDVVAKVVDVTPVDDSHCLTIALPKGYEHLIAPKGSVTLNGVSLTVNDVKEDQFTINIISHTWEQTNLSGIQAGGLLNMEVDLIARYLVRAGEVLGC